MISFKKIKVNFRHSLSSRVSAISLNLFIWISIIPMGNLQSARINMICEIISSGIMAFTIIWDYFLCARFPSSPKVTVRDYYFGAVSWVLFLLIMLTGLFNRNIFPLWMGDAIYVLIGITILYYALTKPGDREPDFVKFRYFKLPEPPPEK